MTTSRKSLAEIGSRLDELLGQDASTGMAEELLSLGEQVLEHWVAASGRTPTLDEREGFRLLALHRQGAHKDPSFNACRETCRELAWHYNLLTLEPEHPDTGRRARMMVLVARHLHLFISGKMENRQLGEFCCSSRPLRNETTDGVDGGRPPQ
ncbi:MAG: hypothetical protein PVJ33_15415 [Lysobacterales bacterium]